MNLLITSISLLVWLLAAFRCFFAVDKTSQYKAWVGYWGAESLEIAKAQGRGNDNNYCVPWLKATKDQLFDGPWRFGRAMGVLGAIICIPFGVLSLYILVYKVQTRFFTAAIGAHISMSIISLLLLVGLASNVCSATNCKMGPGGYFAIVSFFLWLGAAFVAFKLRGLSLEHREGPGFGSPANDRKDENQYPAIEGEKPLPALPPSENLSQRV